MPLTRRNLLSSVIPLAALSLSPVALLRAQEPDGKDHADGGNGMKAGFAGPPVVQNPGPRGCSITCCVSGLSTMEVHWGFKADALDKRAVASHHGLVCADDRLLTVHIQDDAIASSADGIIYYKPVMRSLKYHNAYELQRGDAVEGPVRRLMLPRLESPTVSLCFVNDTHEAHATIETLAKRIQELDPSMLVWNGDACNDFNMGKDLPSLLLKNGMEPDRPACGGWASTRPLWFVPGNHDMRGQLAHQLSQAIVPWSTDPYLPYNHAMRWGPLAIVSLCTGEDKPDAHPVFAGMADYEAHRRRQGDWLRQRVAQPDIASAPFKIALTHIPLRGLEGENDGKTINDFARWSGEGSDLWMPILQQAKFHAVISGHTHAWRIQPPEAHAPVCQIVGGGPKKGNATIIHVRVQRSQMDIVIEDLAGKELARKQLEITV